MKYLVQLNNNQIILTAEQLETLTSMLDGCNYVEEKYMGNGKGTDGGNYIKLASTYRVTDQLALKIMTDEAYEAMQLVTKLHVSAA